MNTSTLPSECQLDSRWYCDGLLYFDAFDGDLSNWSWELEKGGTVKLQDGVLDVEVSGGATIWFRQKLEGPVLISYEACAVSEGGPMDRASDINCFWMATDERSPEDLLVRPRNGAFSDYHMLRTYYVGLGGNYNSTTRMRRYIGDPKLRPMLPEHDLSDPRFMIEPNHWHTISLVACDELIQYFCDGSKYFELIDDNPYTAGWFAMRTTKSHVRFRNFQIYRLKPEVGS